MIKVKNITKSFDEKSVLKGISCEFEKIPTSNTIPPSRIKLRAMPNPSATPLQSTTRSTQILLVILFILSLISFGSLLTIISVAPNSSAIDVLN